MQLEEIKRTFAELYGEGEVLSFHSPGRVNLIGEHTDYNGGYVLPCALSLGTYGIARKRQDSLLRLASTNFGIRPVEFDLKHPVYSSEHKWANYFLGVAYEFNKLGCNFSGVDLLVSGNLSSNAGLSSSASIELLMSVVLDCLYECKIPMTELVMLSQRAENDFVGLKCGIMDQFAVGMGKKGMAMLLDCATLNCEYIPVKLAGHSLVIANTNSPRSLADSKYNERRVQCEAAVDMLRARLNIELLGEISTEMFEEHKYLITDETILKRAQHVVYEIERTKQAAQCLIDDDLVAFGKLMNESHNSLSALYEVAGFALDAMVYAARKQDGVLGSRMTGGGFGGCTVSLVREDCVPAFIKNVAFDYEEKTSLVPEFYIADIGDGTRRID